MSVHRKIVNKSLAEFSHDLFFFSHALDLHERSPRALGENTGQKYALAARNARKALEIIDKFRIATSFAHQTN